MAVLIGRKPGEPESVLVPMHVSAKTIAWMTRPQAEAYRTDLRALKRVKQKEGHYTTPSGRRLPIREESQMAKDVAAIHVANCDLLTRELDPIDYHHYDVIMRALRLNNIPTEEFEVLPQKHGRVTVLVRRKHPSMSSEWAAGRLTPEIMRQYCRTIGRMHAVNLRHGHPHPGNFFIDERGRVGVFDFSRASPTRADFSNPASVFRAFREDYRYVARAIIDSNGFKEYNEERLWELVKPLRMKQEDKRKLHAMICGVLEEETPKTESDVRVPQGLLDKLSDRRLRRPY